MLVNYVVVTGHSVCVCVQRSKSETANRVERRVFFILGGRC